MKVTERHFAEFVAEFERLIKLFGVNDWNISYAKTDNPDNAQLEITNYQVACAIIAENLDKGVTPAECARHEAIHLLIAPLALMAKERFVSIGEVMRAEERVVRMIENVVFKTGGGR